MKDTKKLFERRRLLIRGIIKHSDKEFGKGATTLLSSLDVKSIVRKTIQTGSVELDRILAKDSSGKYGMPVGRIVGISGREASGKTTLGIHLMKSVQEMGGIARLVETEHAFDPNYAKALGLNLDELLISQPDYLEQGLDMMRVSIDMFKQAKEEYIVETGNEWDVPMVIVFDSIAGAPPKAEWEATSDEDEQARALHARRLSRFFRNINGPISSEQICLVCMNQIKTDTNVKYGSKDTEIGGAALKFHASIRLDLRFAGVIHKTSSADSEKIGIESKARTVKNKVMAPYKETMLPIIFGQGIDSGRALGNALIKKGIIEKSGNTISVSIRTKKGEKLFRAVGKEKFLKEIKEAIKTPLYQRKLEELLSDN